jgi:Bacterial regulatory protein, Fis family
VSKLLMPGAAEPPASPTAVDATGATKLVAVAKDILEADVSYAEARRRLLVEFERCYVARMLTAHRGNVTRAAAASGLARRNFQLIRARQRDET